MKVNLFLVGAQKGGTTALTHLLGGHKSVLIRERELHYFTRIVECDQPLDERAYFEQVCGGEMIGSEITVIGENSNSYISSPEVLDRLAHYNSQAKLIVSLRHPIMRMYSRYQDILRDEPERLKDKPFDQVAIASLKHEHHWTSLGCYRQQVEWLFDRFPRENILVLIQERMLVEPNETMLRISKFLDIDINGYKESFRRVHSGAYDLHIEHSTLGRLQRFFLKNNSGLADLIGDPLPEWRAIDERLKIAQTF